MNDEQVFQLLVETNPVPDVDGIAQPVALHEIDEGGPTMAVDTKPAPMPRTERRAAARRRGPLLAAAAALAVVVAGTAIWANTGGESDVADHPGMSSIEAAYEAMNDGNVAGFYAQLTERAIEADDHEQRSMEVTLHQQTQLRGPCRLLDPSPTSGLDRIQCDVNLTNDFFRPGGIVLEFTETFAIAEDGRIDVIVYQLADRTPADEYSQAFWGWLVDTYPDVYDTIWPVGPEMLSTFNHPAGTVTALEYMDEFLAQSDVYPLSASG